MAGESDNIGQSDLATPLAVAPAKSQTGRKAAPRKEIAPPMSGRRGEE